MAARYVVYPYHVIKAEEIYYDELMQIYYDRLHYNLQRHQPKPLDYSQLTSFLDFGHSFLSPWHRGPPPPPPPSDADGNTLISNDGEQPINNIQSTNSFFSHEVFSMKPEDPDAILFVSSETSKLYTRNANGGAPIAQNPGPFSPRV
ncbi:hypothetical protein FH972_018724 [Carpinus fangiana]|uniref:Uncharacterized protein n=1 Tax=Carpinus fangiana TaxID=176857 RepID=A0A5N6RQ39_9ROSI|nr:hypothetical protein FH972_018724 [Carpinus fangiana]